MLALVLASCSSSSNGAKAGGDGNGDGDHGGTGDGDGQGDGDGDGSGHALLDGGPGDSDAPFDLTPTGLQTLDVQQGMTMPTVTFSAVQGGRPVKAAFSLDRGDAATITSGATTTAELKPTGKVGGMVVVTAGYQGKMVQRQVLIRLHGTQDGASAGQSAQIPNSKDDLTAGGGVGGVGGEGLGGAVGNADTVHALDNPASDGTAESLHFLYPYEGTVWPRGLPAPLLMWSWSKVDADAIRIELATTGGSYKWTGTFGRPAILAQTASAFIRHPIPQDVWEAATQTAGGLTDSGERDQLTVKLTVLKDGAAAGPITQTWTIAPALLSGTIYYNSYGTQLAKNLGGAVGGDHQFGGAVLRIRVGETGPKLAAGASGTEDKCRVCHSVSADGSRLVAAFAGGSGSSSYAIAPTGLTESSMTTATYFPAMYPDGSFALTKEGQILPMPDAAMSVAPTGLSAVATNLGTPSFDPSGKLLAFNPNAGPSASLGRILVVMNYDPANKTFSKARTVADTSLLGGANRPGWPSFLPDGASLVFHQQSSDGGSVGEANADDLKTRRGAKAQVYWTNTTNTKDVTQLKALNGLDANGTSYLPKLPADVNMTCTADGKTVGDIDKSHEDDVDLNYEPTVSPVASGGYAWVIFTSRRLYGNVATIPPFCSDPRGVDLIQNITTKKLWVAAIDLSAKPGKDASHPAFYLPSQELLAGNARAFWVLDPCKADGKECASGDQCCNGYCTANMSTGKLECGNMPPDATCANTGDKCTSASECCNATDQCVNGFCALGGPL